jgi:hypothetical protein
MGTGKASRRNLRKAVIFRDRYRLDTYGLSLYTQIVDTGPRPTSRKDKSMLKPWKLAANVKHATSLYDLLAALRALEAAIPSEERVDDYGIDICELPIFSSDGPRCTVGVWSWDENQLLLGEGSFMEWCIVDRNDER